MDVSTSLRELAEFDENGLWWIRSVGFSSRGTLVATAEGLVTCQQLWDTRELHLVSLDYGGETREVGAIDVNIDQDLVA